MAALISLSRQASRAGGGSAGTLTYPVDVEDIDVARPELLEGRLDGDVHRLDVVARVVRFLRNVRRRPLEVGRVLMQDSQAAVSRNPLYRPVAEALIAP